MGRLFRASFVFWRIILRSKTLWTSLYPLILPSICIPSRNLYRDCQHLFEFVCFPFCYNKIIISINQILRNIAHKLCFHYFPPFYTFLSLVIFFDLYYADFQLTELRRKQYFRFKTSSRITPGSIGDPQPLLIYIFLYILHYTVNNLIKSFIEL